MLERVQADLFAINTDSLASTVLLFSLKKT